jgi:hypothetical protein
LPKAQDRAPSFCNRVGRLVAGPLHGKLLVHLVNTAGPHRTQSILDSIPPVGPLTVTIRQPAKPANVTLEPSGRSLDFEYRDGRVRLTVPQVAIHEIVVVTASPAGPGTPE